MLELLFNPRKAERRTWELFFVGFFYASLSVLLVSWIFSQDFVLVKYSGILIICFTVMFSLPFVYYAIRIEERKIIPDMGSFKLLKEHSRTILIFLWLFFGFVVAYSLWYSLIHSPYNFKAQVETYCAINRPADFNSCVLQHGIKGEESITGSFFNDRDRLFLIFINNMNVLIFTLIFSLIFGAGSIFILSWNGSVIAAAIGIITKADIYKIPFGIARYLLHGAPEIASYFIVALAGGIISVAITKHEMKKERFFDVLRDSINLVILAIVVLFIAAFIEVYITPKIF